MLSLVRNEVLKRSGISNKRLKDVGYQIWELKLQDKDLTWLLTCKEDKGKPAIIKQVIPYSDFPLEKIVIWLIDNIALLPSEY